MGVPLAWLAAILSGATRCCWRRPEQGKEVEGLDEGNVGAWIQHNTALLHLFLPVSAGPFALSLLEAFARVVVRVGGRPALFTFKVESAGLTPTARPRQPKADIRAPSGLNPLSSHASCLGHGWWREASGISPGTCRARLFRGGLLQVAFLQQTDLGIQHKQLAPIQVVRTALARLEPVAGYSQ